MSRLGGPRHLIRRFFWSLWPGGTDPDAEERVVAAMSPAERALHQRLSPVDRLHGVAGVASVVSDLGERATDEVVVAAALHDVGKLAAGLGTSGRVGATLVAALVGERRLDIWAELGDDPADAIDDPPCSWRRRVGRYARHDVIGAAALRRAGSAGLVVDWAAYHHAPARCPGDPELIAALCSADEA
ncbi:MAG: hypothetical protein RIE08_02345 [Acidimicrobiales bacterium]